MGSTLGALFGGGGSSRQDQRVDPVTEDLNRLRLAETTNLFRTDTISNYAKPSGLSSLSGRSQGLINRATRQGNLFNLQDYTNLGLDATSNYISQIATPQIMSQAALQGAEYGGVVPESIARATAEIGLPFVQSLPGAALAGTEQASQLVGLSDLPRQLKLEDFLRRQGLLTTGLTGIPYTPAMSSRGSTREKSIWEAMLKQGG